MENKDEIDVGFLEGDGGDKASLVLVFLVSVP